MKPIIKVEKRASDIGLAGGWAAYGTLRESVGAIRAPMGLLRRPEP